MTATTLTLPTPPAAARRSAFPFFAAIVPVIGAVVLWQVTGSTTLLWMAALGPVIAVAAALDTLRTRRRERREGAREYRQALVSTSRAVTAAHEAECVELDAALPDLSALVDRGDGLWRAGRSTAEVMAGRGARASALRVTGGSDDAESLALRRRARTLEDAPVGLTWRAGVCVVGDELHARAVLRALLAKVCLRHPPTDVRIAPPIPSGWEWVSDLPHRAPGDVPEATVQTDTATPVSIVLVGPGEQTPRAAHVLFTWSADARAVDPRCGVVLHLEEGLAGRMTHAPGAAIEVETEALSERQARAVAALLSARAGEVYGDGRAAEGAVRLSGIWTAPGTGSPGTLAVALGAHERSPVLVDLVEDGPHAVVIGITGAGKSELLITWVTALCRAYSTAEVAFLLADFKGGTAFEPLTSLPHVTGVLTDLDGASAARAISSLRAELRRREGVLAQAGARDITQVRLERLVIVVDEFAALLTEHSELGQVFADIAARGRALGMHLILGTQRASGVMREALLANCPLRLALRAADAADSRLIVGSDEAARLSGSADQRGVALLRRGRDRAPCAFRVALTDDAAREAVVELRAGEQPPRRPWLPDLPALVRIDDVERAASITAIRLGLVDVPEEQRRRSAHWDPRSGSGLLVVGSTGSGKTDALALCAGQLARPHIVDADPEAAWDALAGAQPGDATVIVDDLDALLHAYPDDYAAGVISRIETLLRRPGAGGVVASVRRVGGSFARIAELFSQRLVLAMPSRTELAAAGAPAQAFRSDLPPGRGVWSDGRPIQLAWVGDARSSAPSRPAPASPMPQSLEWGWRPADDVTAVVTRNPRAFERTTRAYRAIAVSRVGPGSSFAELAAAGDGRRVIVVGDPDQWQQRWGVLGAIRESGALVVDSACAAEYRLVTGSRDLPPYARPGAGRAWLVRAGASVRRIHVAVLEIGEPQRSIAASGSV